MMPSYPWLCQGDIFEYVPLVTHGRNELGAHTFQSDYGSAVLLTEGCQLDKPHTVGAPIGISFLQFAPITPLEASSIRRDILGQLRSRRTHINPPALVYFDDIGDGREGIADLGQAYPLESRYFGAVIQDFARHAAMTDESTLRAVATSHATRRLTMVDEEREVLHRKQTAYWTYTKERQ